MLCLKEEKKNKYSVLPFDMRSSSGHLEFTPGKRVSQQGAIFFECSWHVALWWKRRGCLLNSRKPNGNVADA